MLHHIFIFHHILSLPCLHISLVCIQLCLTDGKYNFICLLSSAHVECSKHHFIHFCCITNLTPIKLSQFSFATSSLSCTGLTVPLHVYCSLLCMWCVTLDVAALVKSVNCSFITFLSHQFCQHSCYSAYLYLWLRLFT